MQNAQSKRADNMEEYTKILKHLAVSLERDNTKPSQFFKQVDKQRNGVLQCRELKEGVKDNL